MTSETIYLTKPQFRLVNTSAAFPAFVGGYGSGKTEGLVTRALFYKTKYPTCNIGYYLPTFDLVRLSAFPRFEAKLDECKIRYRSVRSPTPMIEIYRGGQIIFRSMDSPERIVAYEVADSFIDELDTLTLENASAVWKKIMARNRQSKPDGERNTIAVGTTPEGFRFTYEQWKKNPPNPDYELIKASTYSNARNLPSDYIPDLIANYPSQLIQAYIDGEFVNLTAGSVYSEFDRTLNNSTETIKFQIDANGKRTGEDLHIGMDFNVMKMAAVIFVQRQGDPHAVAELTNMYDTPAAIQTIKNKFPGHRIFVYPDASGSARHSANASVSDLALLAQAQFNILVNSQNPLVKDRVLSMNTMICANSKRRFKVNVDLCPSLAEALEKQVYDKNGEPDKTTGLDHIVDAAGYFMTYRFPILRPMQKTKVAGR